MYTHVSNIPDEMYVLYNFWENILLLSDNCKCIILIGMHAYSYTCEVVSNCATYHILFTINAYTYVKTDFLL